MRAAAGLHATSECEADDIRFLVPDARVGVVPNGVDMPTESELSRLKRGGRDSQVLFLGRLHPHKNPDLLLRAWASIAHPKDNSILTFAGPDVAQLKPVLEREAARLGFAGRVRCVGPVAGDAKARLLARARVLVLPSRSENFGNVVAEALSHGTPVIASTATPWKEIVTRGCGWWVRCEEQALASALAEAMRLRTETLDEMGRRGRQWMAAAHSWKSIAKRMTAFYQEVLRTNPSAESHLPMKNQPSVQR
jgi:glycosyltransferase involved in cell wall biosynthesis